MRAVHTCATRRRRRSACHSVAMVRLSELLLWRSGVDDAAPTGTVDGFDSHVGALDLQVALAARRR